MPLSHEDLKALLALNRGVCGGIGLRMMDLLCSGIPASALLEKILEENLFGKSEEFKSCLKEFSADREIENCLQKEIRLVTYWSEEYPAALRLLPHPPALLYVMGEMLPEDSAALAIVGSRYPSLYGISQARQFASRLAEAGITIVSGLAQGIDLAAHEGSLTVTYGRTLAVLGCGIDVDYPRHRRNVQPKILERGAVMTEYPLGTPPLPENFPQRNRIIAGLSLGVLVIEAQEKSGSLITAQQALDQGKDVFALPGPVDRMTSHGTNRLIKEGAHLAENPQDILEVIRPALERTLRLEASPQPDWDEMEEGPLKEEEPAELSGAEREVLEVIQTRGCLSYEDLLALIQGTPGEILALLTSLELKKAVRKERDGRFRAG